MGENTKGPLVRRLEDKLTRAFAPEHLEVINESHIRIRMRAAAFDEMSRVQAHRAVNTLCAEEIEAGLHALALDLKGTG